MTQPPSHAQALLYERPVEILQRLVRFDTTSPPGNEAACIAYLDEILTSAGFATTILTSDEAHPNLVTRLPGRGEATPLLMYGHVDVVTTQGQAWTHPPFEGKVADGFVWGRGTLDMKGAITMMLVALLRAKAEGLVPPGDVILALVSGEEVRGDYGAAHLVADHPDQFEGVRYAIGELGGFSLQVGNAKLYPIMVAEKQICWIRATVRGPAGHGSMPVRGGAMAKLAGMLRLLDERRLPVHITPATRDMVEQIASVMPFPQGLIVRQLLTPALTDRVLPLLGPTAEVFDPILRNTVSPTILQASDKVNVIPGEVSVQMDGRLLPGQTPADLLVELEQIVGQGVEFEVLEYHPGPPEPDMGLFDTLSDILRETDPEGLPVPLIIPGVTDASQFAQLGIQTYGFTPMNLPAGLGFWRLLHGVDERIPVDALAFGSDAIHKLLQRFGDAA